MSRRIGLLIGINHYQDSTFQSLRYAEADATMLARWLGNPLGGDWPSSEMYTLTGAEASKERVESLIAQLCLKSARPDDLILLYFASHTFIDETSGDGLLACTNTSFYDSASAIHLPSLINQVVAPSRAAQVIVLLDCYQSDTALNRLRAAPSDFRSLIGQSSMLTLQQSQGRILYCSCRGNNTTPESGTQGCGSFVYRTIIGLSGPARDAETGQATLQQLHVYLSSSLSAQHQPQAFGQNALPIVLVGKAPVYAGMASSASAASNYALPPLTSPSQRSSATSPGQITYQGVVENSPLVAPDTPRAMADQPFSSVSGPLSISQVEQNYQQQCIKLMQQARQQVAAHNLPDALLLVEQVLHMAPTYGDALTLKVQILGTAGQYQEASVVNEQLLQLEPGNALAWSMYAALLTNTGRLEEAMTAIDRALTLQPENQETLAMRQTIQSSLHAQQTAYAGNRQQPQSQHNQAPYATQSAARESATSFLMGAGLQILAFILGLLGAAMLVYKPSLPDGIGFALESFGLAALFVLAARGTFRYGVTRLFSTIVLCIAAAGMLGGLYALQYKSLINKIVVSPPLIVPVLFLAMWLIAAATLPLLAGIGGFIGGMALGVRRRR